MKYDLVLLHAPSVYDFRKNALLAGPISDVVPSSPVFEMYPIGLTSIAEYLERQGLRVKIINIANRMLMDEKFDVEKKLKRIKTRAFGIDLHWLPHAHGSIELAKIVKNLHPDIPMIFGGLSATYYHKDLIEYPFIDFVMRGDSTEKLMLLLINHLRNGTHQLGGIPNLTWKEDGKPVYNPLSHVPDSLDEFDIPGYRYTIKSVFKYKNFLDPLPYNGWLQYPNTAILTAKGCTQGCLICGGSKQSYKDNCNRKVLAKRSPEKLVEDIVFIQRFSRAPIFILHDIRQAGKEYVDEFFDRLGKIKLKNELVFELFQYANEEFFEKIERVVPKYSIELTLETHDEKIRRYNGKFNCTNVKVIETLQSALKHSCKKIDIFFMVGIPHQDYQSALDNVGFCEDIHIACGEDKRLSYFVAPLAPFLDPASPAFENPEKHGYKKFCHTIEDHRRAITQPSWKYMLSFETDYMTRDDIVKSTYESAKNLNAFKLKYALVDQKTHDEVNEKINKSLEYIEKIDEIIALPEQEKQHHLALLSKEMEEVNKYSICGKHELKWEVKKHYANIFSLTAIGVELLIEDIFVNVKQRFHEYNRRVAEATKGRT
ncbi:TIGR04190 family B12-binding domain/radical SAM domain protein [Mesobacillus subterraneus]|uniref:TIGR04190 family B12-binding domain/radical SAM domain protein n=1 Tax=Mesobacillus subterraneus TaxID=285983 RepID=UPI00203B814B|nr:TIGR04190 family B12-binding domain/radical SAM domain protein [Mesobacillus subterraneus]MCM3662854.1 TIGR04190 family B12-binding domain/radical SAM domain protein [Mesobacillus subterraneus]MCM3682970.1 TIGR04190 family B12-binding domain/radical SAM domain protein [Mesobacillus subterraneus]